MKKAVGAFVVACSLLFASWASFAQLTLTGAGKGGGAAGGRTCTDGTASTAFIARTSGLSNADKDRYCVLLNGLDTDGVTAGLDALYIFAAPNTTTANLNLIQNAYNLTQVGTVTFTAYTGYASDGTSGYFTTGFSSGQYTQNAAGFGAYNLTSRTTGGAGTTWLGANNGSAYYFIGVDLTGTAHLGCTMNDFTFGSIAATQAQGFWGCFRTSSTNINAYRNGSSFGSITATTTAAPVVNMFLLAFNNGGSPGGISTDQLSAVFIGGNQDSLQGNLSSRINTYMTSLGINVY